MRLIARVTIAGEITRGIGYSGFLDVNAYGHFFLCYNQRGEWVKYPLSSFCPEGETL